MPKLFLIPIISLFDVHDFAIRDWLNRLDENALLDHIEYPFRLDRFFSESSQHALICVEDVHNEILHLLDIINPEAVFLDIPIDLVELENKYNKRLISPFEFWSEYYQISAGKSKSQTIYCIYIKGIIDKKIRLIESKEHLPLSVVFYSMDLKKREEIIPVYEDAFDRDGEFSLQVAKVINEIASLRESPKHLWYSPMQQRQMVVAYEETEKFYGELLNRLKRLLKFKIRNYIVKNLREEASRFLHAYEKFLDCKIKEDEIKFSNIMVGLSMLTEQSDYSAIVIFCTPMHYFALWNALKKEKNLPEMKVTVADIDISALLDKMKPFMQKNRIMQSNYCIALEVLGREKQKRFEVPDAVLIPT